MGKDKAGQPKKSQSKKSQSKKSQSKTSKSPFVLKGQCIGFVIKDGCKVKALRLAAPAGELTIKLPKPVRKTLEPTQWLGATLGVIGQRRVNPKTGEVQHKAKEVAVLSPPADLPPLMVATRPLPSTEVPEAMASVPPSMSATSSPATDRPAANPSSKKPATILVCNKSKCCKRGGHEVIEQLEQELSDRQLTDQVKIRRTGCMKQCKAGPNLVMPDKTRYSRIQAGDVPDLVEKHF